MVPQLSGLCRTPRGFLSFDMPKAETSTDRRRRLAGRVSFRSHLMPTPCSNCRRSKRDCKIDTSSGRCSACLSRNSKCDLVVSEKDWEKLDAEKSRLQRELDEIDERRSELDVRRLRLRKQLGLLTTREQEMLRRELSSIEELEKLEEEERQAAKAQQRALTTPAASD